MKDGGTGQAAEQGVSGLGSLLKELRTSRHLTQVQAAEAAGLSRYTLLRWEQGSQQPRVPELNAILNSLQASPEQRIRALSLIQAPRAIGALRSEQQTLSDKDNSETAWVFTPETGDLLRTMRLRRGMTQEYAAAQMGVRRFSVTRWETGDRIPSRQHLNALLDLLGARSEERHALTTGVLLPSELTARTEKSFDALKVYSHHLYWDTSNSHGEALKDLEYLRLERAFANLVPYYAEARNYLIYAYCLHANWLVNKRRYKEAGRYADRVLEAAHSEMIFEGDLNRSILISAQCTVQNNSSGLLRPERGIEILQDWLPLVNAPVYAAWMLSDMAIYMVQAGRISAGLEMSARSCQVVLRDESLMEWRLRRVDRAELLLQTGQSSDAEAALNLLSTEVAEGPGLRLREALCWSKGLLQTGEVSEAQKWLKHAQEEVQNNNLDSSGIKSLEQLLATR